MLEVEINKECDAIFVGSKVNVPYREGMLVETLIKELGLPDNEIGLIVVNGKSEVSQYALKDGDKVEFFPFALGG